MLSSSTTASRRTSDSWKRPYVLALSFTSGSWLRKGGRGREREGEREREGRERERGEVAVSLSSFLPLALTLGDGVLEGER